MNRKLSRLIEKFISFVGDQQFTIFINGNIVSLTVYGSIEQEKIEDLCDIAERIGGPQGFSTERGLYYHSYDFNWKD